MAYLWITQGQEESKRHSLDAMRDCFLPVGGDESVRICRFRRGGETWVVMAAADIHLRINGTRSTFRVLSDHDEIQFHDRQGQAVRMFFSAERMAVVEKWQKLPGARATICGRCRLPLEDGDEIIRCPKCQVSYHSSEQSPCWAYGPTCSCGHRTALALETELSWTPEGI